MDASHLFVLLKRKLRLNRLYYKLYGLDYGNYVDSYFTQLLCIFYRAMLCTARTVLSQDVCPSVCHTPVFCQNS